MTGPKFHALFGGPPRDPEAFLSQRHMDLAASIQSVTEEVMLRLAAHARELTGSDNLVLAGGVALNCVANGVLDRKRLVRANWHPPAAGRAGGALGPALFTWHQLLEKPRAVGATDSQAGSFLGPSFSDEEIGKFLASRGVRAAPFVSDEDM